MTGTVWDTVYTTHNVTAELQQEIGFDVFVSGHRGSLHSYTGLVCVIQRLGCFLPAWIEVPLVPGPFQLA